jgi:hypothetical protein
MKVILTGGNNYNVKLTPKQTLKFKAIQSQEVAIVSNKFVDLTDVDITGLNLNKNNYPVVYNATTGKFVIVDPDVVLSAASTSTGPQPGLPSDFVDTLDVDLDDRIDLDAGSF